LGVAVKDIGLARKDYILQTKCGIRRGEAGTWFDFSKEHIVSSVENSLIRLNTEYIDIFLLHRPDALMEADEVAEACYKLRGEGKIRALGVSNFSAVQIQTLENAGIDVTVNQMQYSLGHTTLVDAGFNVNMKKDESVQRAGDSFEYCRLKKIALQAWSPLQYGFFEGVFLDNEKFQPLNAELKMQAEKYNCQPSTIALAWILRTPAFAQVVTGTTSPERMQALCASADIELSREDWYRLYHATGKDLP
jgi:predicted oxidoreductase